MTSSLPSKPSFGLSHREQRIFLLSPSSNVLNPPPPVTVSSLQQLGSSSPAPVGTAEERSPLGAHWDMVNPAVTVE
ncbi:hypothetical protein CEXT_217291 [Caerostris extrusa]|uniref:Uncharacterized protein n=1 Tax=Caerostris extrusa TaxID=172846 RepID=A0AAV4SLN0_CAEEX|nr:hypothetical protein CEXT_217291 [Caerostris extrusa]